VAELDFISVHTYPVWEYKHIHEALDYTKDNVASVARLYPGKPIVITEAGWCTNSNGRGMHAEHAVQELQAVYYQDLMDWTRAEGLLCFVFEAFDEPWKGSPDPLEPEKHWGLFTVDRRPKLVMHALFPELLPAEGAACDGRPATGRMHTHRTPDVALWDQYRALREQWTHEDMLVGQRVTWLILVRGPAVQRLRVAVRQDGGLAGVLASRCSASRWPR
jgi:hypothetical protein